MTYSEAVAARDRVLLRIGVLRVQHGDKSIEYMSAEKELAIWDREISLLSPTTSGQVVRHIRVNTSSGNNGNIVE